MEKKVNSAHENVPEVEPPVTMAGQVAKINRESLGLFDLGAAHVDSIRRSVGSATFQRADLVIGPDIPNMFSLRVNGNGRVADEVAIHMEELLERAEAERRQDSTPDQSS